MSASFVCRARPLALAAALMGLLMPGVVTGAAEDTPPPLGEPTPNATPAILATSPTPAAQLPPGPTVSSGLPEAITGELPRATKSPAPTPAETAAPAPAPKVTIPELRNQPSALDAHILALTTPEGTPANLAQRRASEQFAALLSLAQRSIAKKDYAAADAHFAKALSLAVPAAEKREALTQMAGFYRERKMLAKAAAVSEKLLALNPDDPRNPDLYFELGVIYLESGMYDLAINRFYSVLNSAIAQSDAKQTTKSTRNLSLLAQFEIAEASFAKGDFAAAAKFYSRMKLLDLPEADRPTLAFKYAESLFRLGDYQAAAAALRGFVDQFPISPFNPEARALLARSFIKLKRPDDAAEAVLALLRQEKRSGAPANLARWQRETGRQIAARFYEDGDFRSALTVYQTLATLDPAPEWQWPIVYQIGLCFERLELPDRARQVYEFLQHPAQGKSDPASADGQLPPALDAIRGMAKWREEHLGWAQNNGAQLQALLGPLRKEAAAETPAEPAAAPKISSLTPHPQGKP